MSGIILAGPRVYYAMAQDGLLFKWMGARAPAATARRTSRSSLQAIWSSVLVLTGTYGAIVSRVIYTEWIFFGALALGTIALRRRRALRAGVPRLRAFRSCRSLFALVCARDRRSIRSSSDPRNEPDGLALVAAGLPVYYRLETSSHARDRLPQPLLPAEYMKALQSGESSVTRDDRQRRQPEPPLSRRLQRRGARPSRHRVPRRRCSTSTA